MEYLRAITVMLIAMPFVYMIYDISLDMLKGLNNVTNLKLKPVLINLLHLTVNK